jgi:TonB family protein
MNLRTVLASLSSLALGSSMHAFASGMSNTVPNDPMALLTLGHDKNGLVGSDVKPWHIHGTYRSFDAKGQPDNDGVYEEWWVSASRYKLTFSNPKSTQTDVATGTDLLRDGSQDWESGPELLLRGSLLEPLPDVEQLKEFTLERRSQAVGNSSIDCVGLEYPVRPNLKVTGDFYPTACFDPTLPVLRLFSEGSSTRIIYSNFVTFQQHYIARHVQVFVSGKLAAEMNLDVVENLKELPDTVLAPPATAISVDLTKIAFNDDHRRHWPLLLKKAVPVYPENAKSMRIQGTVNIKVTISPSGHPMRLVIVSGPPMLQEAALEAVRQWVYKPFYVMGQPRGVEMVIHVVFSLG